MNARATLGLVVAFVVLAGAYWLTGYLKQNATLEIQEAKRLFTFESGNVDSLSIEQEAGRPVEAMRNDDASWSITAPFDSIRPNNALWDRVALHASALTNERIIDDAPASLEEYGLDYPELSVIIGTKQGEIQQLSFGALDATAEFRYARLGGGPVFLAWEREFFELNRSLTDLRDTRLVNPGEAGITGITYARIWQGGEHAIANVQVGEISVEVDVVKSTEGEWVMQQPVSARAHQERVDALAKELQFATGREYIDEPKALSEYGLNPPWARIAVSGDASGEPRVILIGSVASEEEGGGIFVKLESDRAVFVIDGHLLTLLPETPEAFRDPKLFMARATNLKAMRYHDDYNDLLLTNEPGAGWTLVQPAYDDTDQKAVSDYIAYLKRITVGSFPAETAETGLDRPRMTLEFTFGDDMPPATILVGNAVPETENAEFYARNTDGTLTTISMSTVLAMTAKPFTFRSRLLFPFDPAKVRALTLTFEAKRYVLEKLADRWRVMEPADEAIESQSDALGILEALGKAYAVDIAEPPPSPDVQGLAEPVLEAIVTMDDGSTIGPMKIGATMAASSRNRFITVASRPELYYVDQSLVDDVREALRGITPKN